MNFPYFQGDLLLGFDNPSAICCGWTPKKSYEPLLAYTAAIGNLYSYTGIGYMIRNLLATPSVRHLIIVGTDATKTLEAVVKHSFTPKQANLEQEYIDLFYKRVKIHDWREKTKDEIKSDLLKLRKGRKRHEPLVLPLPEVKTPETFPSARSGHIIRADSIRYAHRMVINRIWRFGYDLPPDKEGHFRRQIWQLTIILGDDTKIENIPNTTPELVEAYCHKIWTGQEPETDAQGNRVTYRYGHTMRYKFGDQIAEVIKILKKSPVSFRPVITLWEPMQSLIRDDEPCLITVHPFLNGDKLEMYCYIRTNEMFTAWPTNAAGLRYVQERMAEELGVKAGELTITSGSAHLYDYSFKQVEEYVNQPRPHRLEFDPQGDWRLWKEWEHDKEVVGHGWWSYRAEHYYGGVLIQSICEYTVDALSRRIEPFVGVGSHGIHIGRELERLAKGD